MEPTHYDQMRERGHTAAMIWWAAFLCALLGVSTAAFGILAEIFMLFLAVSGFVRWSIFVDTQVLIHITLVGSALVLVAYGLHSWSCRWAERAGLRFK